MAVPAQKFTWNHQYEAVETNDPDLPTAQGVSNEEICDRQIRLAIYFLKQMLVSTQGGWTCIQSCGYRTDTPGWYADANDNWTDANSVRFDEGGSNYSWMILQNDNVKSGFQLLLSCHFSASGTEQFYLWFSHSGSFTGGTSSSRPTAPDEYYIKANGNMFLATSLRRTVHVFTSTAGTNTRLIIGESADVQSMQIIERFDDANRMANPPNDGEAVTGCICYVGGMSVEDPSGTDHGCQVNGVRGSWHGSMEGVYRKIAGDTDFLRGPDLNGDYYIVPIICAGYGSGSNGILGIFDDLYGISKALPSQTYVPSNSVPDWIVIDGIMFPTGGTILDI